MKVKYLYINNPLVNAIYIQSLSLLIITTNIDGQNGIIYFR